MARTTIEVEVTSEVRRGTLQTYTVDKLTWKLWRGRHDLVDPEPEDIERPQSSPGYRAV